MIVTERFIHINQEDIAMIIVNDSLTRTYLLQRPGHPELKLEPRHEAEFTEEEMLSGAVSVSLVAIEADSQAEPV